MESPQLSRDAKRRLQLAGLAEAWLRWPIGYPREFNALIDVLEEDEDVLKVFTAFPGRWSLSEGLLFLTDTRLIHVRLRWFRRRVVSIPFSTIRQARVVEIADDLDLVIDTSSNEKLHFRRGVGDPKSFLSLFNALEAELGDRFVGLTR